MSDQPNGPDQPPGDDEFYDRRSGTDRRGGRDRRRAGRRRQPEPVDVERRSGKDRRKGPRRRVKDRRRLVDPRYKKKRRDRESLQYSADDIAAVRHMLSHAGHGTTCPVCEGPFTLGPVTRRAGRSERPVWCSVCGRATVVTDCVLVRVMILTRIDGLRDALQTVLTDRGHDVLTPRDTGTALAVYEENPADAVLMDALSLEQMDGLEFIRRLREQFADPYIVIIAPRVSHHVADPSAAATRLGASRVVRTPFTREEILQAVNEARS